MNTLLEELQIPKFARKANLPRVILIGLIDKAQWQNKRFDELTKKLPRGRADLFNLALGHISRSFLVWAYMGMTVKAAPTTPMPSSVATPPTVKLNLSNLDSPVQLSTSTVYAPSPWSTTSSSPWVTPKQLAFSPMPDYLSLSNSPIDEPVNINNKNNDDDDDDEDAYAEIDRLFVEKLFNTISSQENCSENE